jgi:hypothetical protein
MQLLSVSHSQQVSAGISLPNRPEGMSCECWSTLFSFSFASSEGLISNDAADYMMAMNCTSVEMQIAQHWLLNH